MVEESRKLHGYCSRLVEELRVDDQQSFLNYLRMEPAMFDELMRVGLRLERRGTNMRTLPRTCFECLECCWMAVIICRMLSECSTNTLRLLFDNLPLRMHFESFKHVQNIRTSHTNWSECTEGTRNAIRMFRMPFEVAGMYDEFSFERHSGSFRR